MVAVVWELPDGDKSSKINPEIVMLKKIWDKGDHNSFTDLIRWKGKFYCAFREGQGHAQGNGKTRILVSKDGENWSSVALLEYEGSDMRDADFSIMPDGRLMVLGGRFVSFSSDGVNWTKPKRMTFGDGEEAISRWMDDNAFVIWVVHPRPWELESDVIRNLSLPLNLDQNKSHLFHPVLSQARQQARQNAREKAVVN